MKTGKPDAVVRAVVEAALAKNAEDVVALDVRETCGFADTFVICHGASTRQVQTIAAAIIEALRASGLDVRIIIGNDPPGTFTRALHPRHGRHDDPPPDVIPEIGRAHV